MTRDEFQQEHGAQYGQILRLDAFTNALILLSLEITQEILRLDDNDIRNNSPILLADYRGRLKHEHALLTLPIPPEPPPAPITEEYPDRVQEAFEQFNQIHKK